MNMNDFVRHYAEHIDKTGLYEPSEPILIETDFNSSGPFDPYMRFKLGIVCNAGIIYNEKASDGCSYMTYLTHRYRINGKVYDLTKYENNIQALPAFIAMVEENIDTPEALDLDDIIL